MVPTGPVFFFCKLLLNGALYDTNIGYIQFFFWAGAMRSPFKTIETSAWLSGKNESIRELLAKGNGCNVNARDENNAPLLILATR